MDRENDLTGDEPVRRTTIKWSWRTALVQIILLAITCSSSIGCGTIQYQVTKNSEFKFTAAYGEVGSYMVAKNVNGRPEVPISSEVLAKIIAVTEQNLDRLGYLNVGAFEYYQGVPDFQVSYRLERDPTSRDHKKLLFSIDMTSSNGMRKTRWIWRGTAAGIECAHDGSCDELPRAAEALLTQFPAL